MAANRSAKKQPNPTRGYMQYSQPPGHRVLSTGTSRNNTQLTGQERFDGVASDLSRVKINQDWKSTMPAPGLPIKGEKSTAGRARKV